MAKKKNNKKFDRYGHRLKGQELPRIMIYGNLNLHQRINIKSAYDMNGRIEDGVNPSEYSAMRKPNDYFLHAQTRRVINNINWDR